MGTVTIVKASAGSGKTYRLAYEYVRRVVTDPDLYRSILAVTFTNKATEEMKRRITAEINDLANGRTAAGKEPSFLSELSRDLEFSPEEIAVRAKRVRTKILHDYSRFTVLTIDKFFQRIIRAFLRELDIESDFSLELNTDTVLADAADRLIEATVSDTDLRRWIAGFIEEQIDEGRRWDVRGDIISLGRQLFSEGEHTVDATSGHERKEALSSILKEALSKVAAVKSKMTALAQEAVGRIEGAGLTVADFSYAQGGVAGYLYRVAAGKVEEKYGSRVSDALVSDEKWTSKTSPRKGEVRVLVPVLRPILGEIIRLYDENGRFFHTAGLVRENYRTYAVLSDLARSV
ncbi:MAG: UvrD-helicase domain-containing protein, partial [Rikenellaceae bacterium]|nr:UvrD-helicase domain-containing protein [Rikenellaceae bacterium]